jgi:hypothetical protein
MIPARVRPGRPMIAAAVAVTALLSGAGVALAASSSSSAPRTAAQVRAAVAAPSPSSWPSRCPVRPPWLGLARPRRIFAIRGPSVPLGFGAFGFAPFGAIHGQFVAAKPGGGYQTIDIQRGTVTAVSTRSLTVKSRDGYTRTYQVTSSTKVDAQRADIGSVKAGQTVSVLATVRGSSATATQIVDFAALPKAPRMPEFLKPGSRHMFRIGPCASWVPAQARQRLHRSLGTG